MSGSSGVWPFCTACTMTTLPQSAPGTFRFNGIGTALLIGSGGACPHCGSVVRRRYVTLVWVPVIPLERYRIVYVDGSRYIGRRMPAAHESATAELAAERAAADMAVSACAAILVDQELRHHGDHPDVAEARHTLGRALFDAGRVADAAAELEEAAAGRECHLGPLDAATVQALRGLAQAYELSGHPSAATAVRRQVSVRLHPQAPVDSDLPEMSRKDTRLLASGGGAQKQTIRAHAAYLDACEERLGELAARTLRARFSLATELRTASRMDEAIRVFESTLAGRVRSLGPDHPDTTSTRDHLLLACADADRRVHDPRHPQFVEAAAEARQRLLGPDDVLALASRIRVGDARWKVGRRGEAITCWKEALADCERVLGIDHPLSRLAADSLREVIRPPAT